MWSLEHIQVPVERKLKRCEEVTSQEADNLSEGADPKNASKKLDLFKNMKSMSSNEGNGEWDVRHRLKLN